MFAKSAFIFFSNSKTSRAVCTGCPKRYFYIFQSSDVLGSLVSVSYTHLDVYKRQDYEDINGNVDDLNSAIEALSAEFDTLREKASESAKAVAQTDSILKYIQNVATQMTLLGFNASIEAKHVGEAGAG